MAISTESNATASVYLYLYSYIYLYQMRDKEIIERMGKKKEKQLIFTAYINFNLRHFNGSFLEHNIT